MKITENDRNLLEGLVQRYGQDAVAVEIRSSKSSINHDLTIVANGGLHTIPNDYIFGELYVASEGNLNFADQESVLEEIEKILTNLRVVLKSQRWRKVYLLPFGHSVVSMNIKMAVFRTLRIETSDIFYFGNGNYGIIETDTRRIMLS